MILADTSIWVDHFRNGNENLQAWLQEGSILHHVFVAEELASGHLKNRTEIMRLLNTLPQVPAISHSEYLYFIEEHRLYGKGLGMVDIHLLGAAMAAGARLATFDKPLARTANNLGILIS